MLQRLPTLFDGHGSRYVSWQYPSVDHVTPVKADLGIIFLGQQRCIEAYLFFERVHTIVQL